jgi:hypothetical protein
MVRLADRSGKRKAISPPTLPPPELDVVALRQHRRAAGERRLKAREDVRRVPTSKSRELKRRGSPLEKRSMVIHMSTSEEEAAEECERSPGTSDRS